MSSNHIIFQCYDNVDTMSYRHWGHATATLWYSICYRCCSNVVAMLWQFFYYQMTMNPYTHCEVDIVIGYLQWMCHWFQHFQPNALTSNLPAFICSSRIVQRWIRLRICKSDIFYLCRPITAQSTRRLMQFKMGRRGGGQKSRSLHAAPCFSK